MKKLIAAIAVSILTLVTTHAGVSGGAGPATFKLDAFTQATDFHMVGGKTNQTATSTNITAVIKGTVAKTPFDSADMLALLTNSFHTNFPAGSQLGMRFAQIVVVDSTGSNIVFIPTGNVVSFQFEEELVVGTVTEVETLNSSGEHSTGSASENFVVSATLTYDDTLQTTGDGTHTKFTFKGLLSAKSSVNLKNDIGKSTIEFQGTGGGPVRGVDTILTGTISAKIPNPVEG